MAQGAKRVARLAARLVVEVVLIELRVLPQAGQIACGHEPAEGVEGGEGIAGALLAVVTPGAAGVGVAGVIVFEERRVVPVTRWHPGVRGFLLARYSYFRATI